MGEGTEWTLVFLMTHLLFKTCLYHEIVSRKCKQAIAFNLVLGKKVSLQGNLEMHKYCRNI